MTDARRDLDCQEVVELVTDFLDGALPAAEAAAVEHHLGLCDGCDRYVRQMRRTIASVGDIHEEPLPAGARERLIAAFKGYRARDVETPDGDAGRD